jgi:hypothetical protein
MIDWIIYLGIGEILIFIWMKFPLQTKFEFFNKLHECPLCSGVWIYFFLALLTRVDLLHILGFSYYFPIFSELVTGGVSSFLMWILVSGWKSKFETVIIR